MINTVRNLPIISESVTIDVVPLSRHNSEHDLAKITANICLAQPLQQETRFIVPDCNSVERPKIYLPNGDKATMEDFDPQAEEDLISYPGILQEKHNVFVGDPSYKNMEEYIRMLVEYHELKSANQIVTIPAGQDYITFSFSKYIHRDEQTNLFTLETTVPFANFTLNNQAGAKANIIALLPFELGEDLSKVVEAKWTIPNNGTPQDLNREVRAGRIMLHQYWQYDPAVVIRYRY